MIRKELCSSREVACCVAVDSWRAISNFAPPNSVGRVRALVELKARIKKNIKNGINININIDALGPAQTNQSASAIETSKKRKGTPARRERAKFFLSSFLKLCCRRLLVICGRAKCDEMK